MRPSVIRKHWCLACGGIRIHIYAVPFTHVPLPARPYEWVVWRKKAVLDASASEHMSPGSLRPSVLMMHLNQVAQRMRRDLVFFPLGMWVPAWAQTVSTETGDSTGDFRSNIWESRLFPRQAFALSENGTCINYAITGFPQMLKAI